MSRNFELLQKAEQEAQVELKQPQQIRNNTRSAQIASQLVSENPHSALLLDDVSRQQVTKLVQQLFLLPGSCKAVVFSGIQRGNGCSWMTSCSAELLARKTNSSICIVDANFRSPTLHQYFQVSNNPGLAEAILGGGPVRQFVQQLQPPNLWLLPCGSRSKDGPEVLGSEACRAFITRLRAEFDFVLIDTPPMSIYSDTIALGRLADGVALVLEGNSTRREATRSAVQGLEKSSVRLLGVVFNKRQFPIPDFIYKRL